MDLIRSDVGKEALSVIPLDRVPVSVICVRRKGAPAFLPDCIVFVFVFIKSQLFSFLSHMDVEVRQTE